MKPPSDRKLAILKNEFARLLRSLKPFIGDEYRASDDQEDNKPGMCVTFGATWDDEDKKFSWSYQTGDNSYMGGAYSHRHWGVVSLYRRSNCNELAWDAVNEIAESISQFA